MTESKPSLDDLLKDTDPEKLDQPCEDKHLCVIAKHVSKWLHLAPHLISEDEGKEILDKWPNYMAKQKIDFFRKWRAKRRHKATYRRLCKAFWEVDKVALVEKVCEIISSPNSSSEDSSDGSESEDYTKPPPAKKRKLSSDLVDPQSKSLRETYARVSPPFKWPHSTRDPFNLPLIRRHLFPCGPVDEEGIKILQSGNISKYVNGKDLVQLEDVLTLDNEKRTVILVEGGPGMGKRTVAWNVCLKWKDNKSFQEFKMVIFVDLLDPRVQSAKTLDDIIFIEPEEKRSDVAGHIKACEGRRTLFVMDGWDEFKPGLNTDSIIRKLLCRPDKLNLLYSSVLITSCPSGAHKLYDIVSSRLEIIGFTPDELSRFFLEVIKEDKAMQVFQDQLRELEFIENMCYVPLNATIVVHILGQNNHPRMCNHVLSTLICCYIIRYLAKKSEDPRDIPDIKSLDKLPLEVQEPFSKVCFLAYQATMASKVLLQSEDLDKCQFSPDDTLGLIQHNKNCYFETYHFVHNSIQRFLAAVHISNLPPLDQVHIYHKLQKREFKEVHQFYTEMLKTRLEGLGLSDSEKRTIASSEYWNALDWKEKRSLKPPLIELVRRLYGYPPLCSFIAFSLNGVLDLGWVPLSQSDCQSIGYFLKYACFSCKGEFRVSLSKCGLNEHNFHCLMSQLSSSKNTHEASNDIPGSLALDLSTNNIDGNQVVLITNTLNDCPTMIRSLDLWANNIQDGADGLLYLCQALQTNPSVVDIRLGECNLQITEENGPAVVDMLKGNKTLKKLYFGWNNIGDSGVQYIAKGMSENTAVLKLGLRHCGLKEEGARQIQEMLRKNKTLRWLEISGNHLRDHGVKEVIEGLKSNHTLHELRIVQCKVSAPCLKEVVLCLKESQLRTLRIDGKDTEGLADMRGTVNEFRRQQGMMELEIEGVTEEVGDGQDEDSSATGLEYKTKVLQGTKLKQEQEAVAASNTDSLPCERIGGMHSPSCHSSLVLGTKCRKQ